MIIAVIKFTTQQIESGLILRRIIYLGSIYCSRKSKTLRKSSNLYVQFYGVRGTRDDPYKHSEDHDLEYAKERAKAAQETLASIWDVPSV